MNSEERASRLPLAVARRIDAICERFEKGWRDARGGAAPPRAEDFLEDLEGAARESLLLELLSLDWEYRRAAGEFPRADDYLGRFPELPPERLTQAVADHAGTLWSARPDGVEGLPTVAGYVVLEELGRGGMGVVYKARQVSLNRLVALKMIAAPGRVSRRALDRFRLEAEAAAGFRHPAIVPIYEVGQQSGCPYLTMEYVSGGNLHQRLAGGPLAPADAVRLLLPIARAVQHAHEHGIVHRDLKPANVLLDESGAPKIADFGLAKRLLAGGTELTNTAEVIGTPSYMAPEQAGTSAAAVGPWTDVYGLGAILYELLTGAPPFRASTALGTLLLVRDQRPVPPRRVRAGVPRDLETICLKCLGKDPRDRYGSAAALADDLERFLGGKPVRARPAGTLGHALRWSRRHPAVAALMVALTLALVAGYAATMHQWQEAVKGRDAAERATKARDATLDRFRIALAHREWLGGNAARAEELLDSCSDEQKKQWEWRYVRRLCHSQLHTLAGHTATVRAVAYRPEVGRKLATPGGQLATAGLDGTVRLWDLGAKPPTGVTLVASEGAANCVAYRRDGGRIASGHDSGVVLIWQPDGQPVGRLPARDPLAVASVAYLDGDRLAVARADGRVEVWDAARQTLVRSWAAHAGKVSQVAGSPNGQMLATASSVDANVRVWNAATGERVQTLPPHPLSALAVAFSPDGGTVASAGSDLKVRLYVLATGRERLMLADHAAPVQSVGFSPDGGRVASAGGDGAMNVCDAATGRLLYALHGHSGGVAQIAFSPDGETLASAGEDRTAKLWDATAGSQEAASLPSFLPSSLPSLSPSLTVCFDFSPDGRRLAAGMTHGRVSVWDLATHTGVQLPHPGRVRSVAFSPDANELVSVGEDGKGMRWALDGERGVPLPDAPGGETVAVAYRSAGAVLVVRRDKGLALWLNEGGRETRLAELGPVAPDAPEGAVAVTAFSGDRGRLAVATAGRVAVHDTHTGKRMDSLPAEGVTALALDRQGEVLAVGSSDGVLIRHLTGDRVEVRCRDHAGAIHGLAFTPDGRRLASSAQDMTVRLWDTQTGEGVLTLQRGLHNRSPLAFSRDGVLLASVGLDLEPRVWSAADPGPTDERLARERALVWRDGEALECRALRAVAGRPVSPRPSAAGAVRPGPRRSPRPPRVGAGGTAAAGRVTGRVRSGRAGGQHVVPAPPGDGAAGEGRRGRLPPRVRGAPGPSRRGDRQRAARHAVPLRGAARRGPGPRRAGRGGRADAPLPSHA